MSRGASGASGASGVSLPPASAAPPDTAPTNNSTLPPLTHPRIKPMSKTPPLENSGALAYVDDILGYSLTLEDHINLLHILFHHIREANCQLKVSKCFLARPQVEYLGFSVGREGCSMVEAYRKSLTQWPLPLNKKNPLGP